VLYLTTPSILKRIFFNDKVMEILGTGKDLKGSDRGLFKAVCQHFPGVTQKTSKSSSRTDGA
jgi:hypothetical protein